MSDEPITPALFDTSKWGFVEVTRVVTKPREVDNVEGTKIMKIGPVIQKLAHLQPFIETEQALLLMEVDPDLEWRPLLHSEGGKKVPAMSTKYGGRRFALYQNQYVEMVKELEKRKKATQKKATKKDDK